MNHNSPIRNDKLLREAYESGRRDALNEQASKNAPLGGGQGSAVGQGMGGGRITPAEMPSYETMNSVVDGWGPEIPPGHPWSVPWDPNIDGPGDPPWWTQPRRPPCPPVCDWFYGDPGHPWPDHMPDYDDPHWPSPFWYFH